MHSVFLLKPMNRSEGNNMVYPKVPRLATRFENGEYYRFLPLCIAILLPQPSEVFCHNPLFFFSNGIYCCSIHTFLMAGMRHLCQVIFQTQENCIRHIRNAQNSFQWQCQWHWNSETIVDCPTCDSKVSSSSASDSGRNTGPVAQTSMGTTMKVTTITNKSKHYWLSPVTFLYALILKCNTKTFMHLADSKL
jgi:hypothetical protein